MTAYVDTVPRPPRTLFDAERARLLKITGEHRDGFRDHMIYSVAFGTGLREFEIAGLDNGDVFADERVKRQFTLRVFKRSTKTPPRQDVYIPDQLFYKLSKFRAWKRAQGESLEPTAPLFISREGGRIATRTIRHLHKVWQERAGFDRHYKFHSIRHTALTTACREKGLEFANRMARHKRASTTLIYTAPSDEDLLRALRDLPC